MKFKSIMTMLALCGICAVYSYAQDTDSKLYEGPKETLHVYLLIGQSNMAGRAPFTKTESGPIEGVYLFNETNQWEPASNPLNRYSTIRKDLKMQKMNPGYSFSKVMFEKKEGVSIGLVVNAKGGTSIEQWRKGSHFYKEAVRRVKEAQNTGTVKGILWHQGEGNSNHPEGYLDKLKTLIADLRRDIGLDDLPFVAGQIYHTPAINDQIARLPETVPFTGFASSKGLKVMDRWHFDSDSMKLLGTRYAEQMLKIESKAPTENCKQTKPD